MHKRIFFLVFTLYSSLSFAKDLGLGILLFGPTSISVQNYFDSGKSLDGAMGWNLSKDTELYLHSTYLFHRPNQFQIETLSFDFFYGFGAYLESKKKDSRFGGRFAVGSAYQVKTVPIEALAEIAAHLNLVPNTEVQLLIGIGGRYYF
jgi:hypothetical protein